MEQLMVGLTDKFEDEEIPSDSDTEAQNVDEKPHARLLDAISTMDGSKRLKHTLRTVHGQTMSEGGLKNQDVQAETLMSELMGSLQQTGSFRTVKKQLESTYSGSAVETPAPKHVQEKMLRVVGYEKNVKELSKWEPVVEANRKAEQLKFPLEQPNRKLLNTHMRYRPVTAMDKEIQALLAKVKPEHKLKKGEIFTPAEERQMAAMSLEEAKKRRAELLAKRAILYNKNSKLRWQNKIKSKRYRRALKKEKEKKAEKELEELAAADPQALLDKMEETEKRRILERGRLRHTGGKFAREAKIFSKYDEEKRQQIQEMLQKHKELVNKREIPSSSESEDENDDAPDLPVSASNAQAARMWMRPAALPTAADLSAQVVGYEEQPGEVASLESTEETGEQQSSEGDGTGHEEPAEEIASLRSREEKTGEQETHIKDKTDHEEPAEEVKAERACETDRVDFEDLAEKVVNMKPRKQKKKKANGDTERDKTVLEPQPDMAATLKPKKRKKEVVETLAREKRTGCEELPKEVDNMKPRKRKKKTNERQATDEDRMGGEEQVEEMVSLTVNKKRKKKRDEVQGQDHEDKAGCGGKFEEVTSQKKKTVKTGKKQSREKDNAEVENSVSKVSDVLTTVDMETLQSDEKMPLLQAIGEVFEDDDIVEDFLNEKKELEAAANQEQTPSGALPGWGSWAGPGVVPSKHKKRKPKKPKATNKKTNNKIGHVIMSSKTNKAVSKHMITKVPFPYKTLNKMKAVVSKPIGRDFNTEQEFKEKIKRRVIVSKIGQIIKPISDHALLAKKSKVEADISVPEGPQKKKMKT